MPDENIESLLALLPKLNARLISIRDERTSQINGADIIEPLVSYDGQYFYDIYEVSQARYEELTAKYSNAINKNNRDVGQMATEIVADYLTNKIPDAKIRPGSNGADLELSLDDKVELLEVKGTTANTISWPKIKVSSKNCHDSLKQGMTMVRVINTHTKYPKLYLLKYGRDFELAHEDRWSVHPVR